MKDSLLLHENILLLGQHAFARLNKIVITIDERKTADKDRGIQTQTGVA